ncbi:hypothetical protein E3P92_02994 [Wallemia ichthyophaga]|uniref:Guanine deaminase n=2 Tax=Wallemia ichthyophaga TaxID=245174 RepID=A0A4T0KXZ5_WALIC|nr:Guanine deaminase [Wallemia ichthyophaga EXF-994]TIA71938.1 hypothetical protein E3P91_02331 [Wallemia ichthyophaga]EOQ99912.1 Guanine deaminase [Wallemia ichthyophaga EXF-994]TIA84589.1 hypothetical protein E3P98_00112 [Wallemia ichthyophaga]TIB04289.1 hypothetical protein E3P95_00237 [Wallemia ichthyophaga]TIB05482.1 hypothetical protein E3P94_00237 [Wallemia ichthyophaga]
MIYVFPLIHALDVDRLEYIQRAAIEVNHSGTITKVEHLKEDENIDGDDVVHAHPNEFLVPGFVDTHSHAPQFSNIGFGFNLELLDWLSQVTFPTESNYQDAQVAQIDFAKVVEATLSVGTTTCSYYSSLHLDATKILAATCHSKGQRALVGKVNMDSHCPDYYKDESPEVSMAQTKEYVDYVRNNLKSAIVHPIITPRFAICCSPELLEQMGEYLKDENLHIQTHLCENKGEIDFTMSLYPNDESYTHIYANRGILSDRTILAHCCHLTNSEMDLIKQYDCGISHCPTSNFNLRSGITDVNQLLTDGITKVGLGSDCSGGYEAGILQSLRDASTASKALSIFHNKPTYLSLEKLFYLATLGGARALDLEKQIGNFIVGKQFDALVIDPLTIANKSLIDSSKQSYISPLDRLKRNFERWLFAGTSANLQAVFVDGKNINIK